MRIVIIGETATGKDYLLNYIVKNYKMKKIVTYTTRPPRNGEINGINYHFISQQDFVNKIKNGFFLEYKTYNTEYGTWYYGTSLNSCKEDNTIIILDKEGYKVYNKNISNCSILIYNTNDIKKFYKSLKRLGENINQNDIDECYRRLLHDKNKFLDLKDNVSLFIEQTYDDNFLKKIDIFLQNRGFKKYDIK